MAAQSLIGSKEQTARTVPVIDTEALTLSRTIVAILIGVVLILGTAIAIRYSEMVSGRYISHGVPPVPAFAALLTFSLVRPFLHRRWPRLVLNRAQALIVHVMLATATVMNGSYQIRAFLPHLVALRYHEGPTGAFPGTHWADFLPEWLAPRDPTVINGYYNGSENGTVPWGAWLRPLFWWSLFLGAIFVGVYCLMLLVRQRWTSDEKLSFPLLNLPLALASDDWEAYGPRVQRRTLFTLGFGVAAAYNGINILHVLVPTIPSPGFYISFAGWFPDRPLVPLDAISLFFMLEAIGIGYFVPLDVSFSTWFFYLLNRLLAVGGMAAGYDGPGFPFTQEQSAGGYIAMGLLLLWGLRHSFRESLRRAFESNEQDSDAKTARWAWIGLAVCVTFILSFCHLAGFSLNLAIPFFLILGLFVLVFARIRAETGVPYGFIYPYSLPKEGLLNVLGFSTAIQVGGPQAVVLFSSLAWLSRHHFAQEHAAYQLDSLRLAQENRIPRRAITAALLIAFVVGLGAAYWTHLGAYYALGSNMAGGGTGQGEFRATVAMQEYKQMVARLDTPPPQDVPRMVGMGGGFVFTMLLAYLRMRWVGSPFHPLGFLLGTAYGDSSAMWFPLFVIWGIKALILKYGGLKVYRQGIPFFLGLTIGHFFFAGVFWPVISLFIGEDSSAYHIYFGG